MKHAIPTIAIHMVLCWVLQAGLIFAQTTVAPNTANGVTALEKKQIRQVAKRFVRRYQHTRDVRPLISEFMVDNYSACLPGLYDALPSSGSVLTPDDLYRGYVAFVNGLYIFDTIFITYNGDAKTTDTESTEEFLGRMLPQKLAKDLASPGFPTDIIDTEDFTNRSAYLKKIAKVERAISAAQRYFRKRKFEQSKAYVKEFNYYQNSDWLGYVVKSAIEEDGIKCTSGTLRFPPGTKIYNVTTPLWQVIQLVKVGDKFKIIMVGWYDN